MTFLDSKADSKYSKGAYFVGSSGDAPDRIYFDLKSAKDDEHQYIDVFDEDGYSMVAIELNANGEYE